MPASVNSELSMGIRINLYSMMPVRTTIRRECSSRISGKSMALSSTGTSLATSVTFER